MTTNEENKTKKGLISRVSNFRENLRQEDREFWGPVSMTLGVIALANAPASNSYIYLINIACGVLLFLIGYWIMPKKLKLWLRVTIPAGFTIFSAGIRIRSFTQISGWASWLGYVLIVIGFGLMAQGFYKYFKNKVYGKNTRGV